MLPSVRGYNPIAVLPQVVFPQPDSPTKPSVSPLYTEKETSSFEISSAFLLVVFYLYIQKTLPVVCTQLHSLCLLPFISNTMTYYSTKNYYCVIEKGG